MLEKTDRTTKNAQSRDDWQQSDDKDQFMYNWWEHI
jgi:hypothetical protein